jgi:hypothetical protein
MNPNMDEAQIGYKQLEEGIIGKRNVGIDSRINISEKFEASNEDSLYEGNDSPTKRYLH